MSGKPGTTGKAGQRLDRSGGNLWAPEITGSEIELNFDVDSNSDENHAAQSYIWYRDMDLRRLTPADAQQYRILMLAAYEKHPGAFTSSVSERSAEPLSWWETRLKTGSLALDVVIGAFNRTQLVGVAGISFNTCYKTRHIATVFGMYVNKSERGNGVAGDLLKDVLEEARIREVVDIVQLTVSEGNTPAIQLYENKGGFSRFGIEPFALKVSDSFVSKIHMWRSV